MFHNNFCDKESKNCIRKIYEVHVIYKQQDNSINPSIFFPFHIFG